MHSVTIKHRLRTSIRQIHKETTFIESVLEQLNKCKKLIYDYESMAITPQTYAILTSPSSILISTTHY